LISECPINDIGGDGNDPTNSFENAPIQGSMGIKWKEKKKAEICKNPQRDNGKKQRPN
jgi:hypothetical protein